MRLALSGFRQSIYNRIELVASEKNVGNTEHLTKWKQKTQGWEQHVNVAIKNNMAMYRDRG